jgi:NADH dehydrogenase/NADH:ubiquinone oxidoreductase subunit G
MITITMDNKKITTTEGEYLLSAAKKAGVDIPTLCHHEAVEPYGGCRLCLVEVTKHSWEGWSKLVTACLYPAEKDLIVHTQSERVKEARRIVLDLLLARCPNTPLIQKHAADYGISRTSYVENPEPTDCILCGLCTRICDHLGMAAISSANRGSDREIAPPFMKAPDACIGCLSCANICPTGFITYTDDGWTREIWKKKFEMLRCKVCGRAHITKEEAAYFAKKQDVSPSYFETCDTCKRRQHAYLFPTLSVVKTRRTARRKDCTRGAKKWKPKEFIP